MASLAAVWPELAAIDSRVREALEIEASYAVYMERQQADIDQVRREELTTIPDGFDFDVLPGLSNELKAKLKLAKPANLAQAGRIDGMTPAALSLLLATLRRAERTAISA